MNYRCSNLSKLSDSSGSESTSPTRLTDDTQHPPSPREVLPVYAKNFTLNPTNLELLTIVRQESCPNSHTSPQVKTRGRPTNAETLNKVRSQSTSSIRNYLCVSNPKRCREEDPLTPSPSLNPLKIIRTHSSPSDPSPLTFSDDADNGDNMESILEKLEEMRKENSQQFSSVKNELINKIETSRQDTIKEFQSVIDNLRQENAKLQDSIGVLEARVATLESSACTTNVNIPSQSLHKKIASASSNALEKHLRRNNIVVRGLPVSASNARDSLNKFIHSNFGITNSVIDTTLFGKNNESIKATLRDGKTKKEIMSQKTKLKPPVYFNHDLTPQESLISKKLRDEAHRQKALNKNVKMGFLKITVDSTTYTYDPYLQEIVPVNTVTAEQSSNSMITPTKRYS